jgi:hypothetical protein
MVVAEFTEFVNLYLVAVLEFPEKKLACRLVNLLKSLATIIDGH